MSSTVQPNIVAVLDNPEEAGAIIWWRLSGELSLETLRDAWGAASLDSKLLPKEPTAVTAMARVLLQRC